MKVLTVQLIPALLILTASGTAASVAAAQSRPGVPAPDLPGVVTAVGDCRAITQASARLACFDAAVARLDAAVQARDVTVLDRESVRKTRRSLFGFTLPRIELFGGREGDDEGEPDFTEIDTTVRRVVPVGYGKYDLVLEDGARWTTTEALGLPPREGVRIRIRKGSIGSYFLNVGRQATVRGKRVG